jgi:hypothetical protein
MVGPVHEISGMAVQQRTHLRSGIEPLQGAASRLAPSPAPALRNPVVTMVEARRAPTPPTAWDVAGHAVDQRPVRGSHGKNPAPPLRNDLSARRLDIHLGRASNLGAIRATTTPLKNVDTFLAPQPCKAARREAVLAQPCRKADKGALVNGPSKGLLCREQPARASHGTATKASTPPLQA